MSGIERVEMAAAFVLHGRAYRETSQLLEILTREHGRVSAVARGARGAKARWRGLLQPFQPLHLSWSGRGPLFTLTGAEAAPGGAPLDGRACLVGWYLNELVLAFTTRGDPQPELFAHYAAALAALAGRGEAEAVLRRFELALLAETGYGLDVARDARDGRPLAPDGFYVYVPERGALPVPSADAPGALAGADLVRIAAGDLDGEPRLLAAAKLLLRRVIAHHLGDRRLRTRDVFRAMHRERPREG